MAIIPYLCKKHGKTTAYYYRLARGSSITKCRECRKVDVSADWWKVKLALLAAYGGKCSCCGESEPRFLTLDHTNGDGRAHRKAGLRGWRLYQWLAKRGYPKDGYRVLCWNCNCARGQFGKCPHEK